MSPTRKDSKSVNSVKEVQMNKAREKNIDLCMNNK